MNKLSEIKLDRETLIRFFKKRGLVILSFIAAAALFGALGWSVFFLSQSINRAVHYDEKKVSGETKGLDIESYNRLKDKWKDFQGGKYVGQTNAIPVNSGNINSSNNSNASENSNTNAESNNANVSTSDNGNTNAANVNQ